MSSATFTIAFVDSVALAATIGGSAVGLAGVGATAWSSWLQRTSAKEITLSQHERERELARGARLFERRVLVYEQMLSLLHLWRERVDAAQRIMRYADEEEPQEPSRDEWRAMNAKLRTIGSRSVGEGYSKAVLAIAAFFDQVTRVRNIREHGGGSVSEALEAMQQAGGEVQSKVAGLEVLVSSELEKL
jgi:hypothetical protein